jgi:hypothetical protein
MKLLIIKRDDRLTGATRYLTVGGRTRTMASHRFLITVQFWQYWDNYSQPRQDYRSQSINSLTQGSRNSFHSGSQMHRLTDLPRYLPDNDLPLKRISDFRSASRENVATELPFTAVSEAESTRSVAPRYRERAKCGVRPPRCAEKQTRF